MSDLIVDVLAAVWHLPLLLKLDSAMSSYPLVPRLLYVTALSVVYAWLFNSTGGSLAVVTVFHAATNVSRELRTAGRRGHVARRRGARRRVRTRALGSWP